jgi:WYL domain
MVHMDGRWYVVGRCRLREALRTFLLDRVSELEVRDETFDRPTGYDAKAYLQRSMPFLQAGFSIEVWLDLPTDKARSHFALHREPLLQNFETCKARPQPTVRDARRQRDEGCPLRPVPELELLKGRDGPRLESRLQQLYPPQLPERNGN